MTQAKREIMQAVSTAILKSLRRPSACFHEETCRSAPCWCADTAAEAAIAAITALDCEKLASALADANSGNVALLERNRLLNNQLSALERGQDADEDRERRNGAHLFATARSLGWKDDGEGALEFLMRRTREVALEDCGRSALQCAPVIDEALESYRQFMLDDDFDYQRAFYSIMERMKVRRESYGGALTAGNQTQGQTRMTDAPDRYFVQGETIRGEPRVYFVSDRQGKHYASEVTTDRRQAVRWCEKMNKAAAQTAGNQTQDK